MVDLTNEFKDYFKDQCWDEAQEHLDQLNEMLQWLIQADEAFQEENNQEDRQALADEAEDNWADLFDED